MPRERKERRRVPVACAAVSVCVGLLLVMPLRVVAQQMADATVTRSTKPVAAAPRVQPAIDGVFDLFKRRSVVALGDAHGLAQEEAFYSALVRDPRFAKEVGNVVVEFGGSGAQSIVDRYENGGDESSAELCHVWTDMIGWLPGPMALGYVNFYANVRAVNLKLAPGSRIKVWLGDPKVDWSKIHSFQDAIPYLAQRDENIFRIVSEQILEKRKKTLLIIGSGHLFGSFGSPLIDRIDKAFPQSVVAVAPFIGYIQPECNTRFAAYAKSWPVPALVEPVERTSLNSELHLPACSYVSPAQIRQIEKMTLTLPPAPPGIKLPPGMSAPSAASVIAAESDMLSGAHADAILYLGPPDALTVSPIDPDIYLDPDYFNEMNRRAQCCTPSHYSLNWDEIVEQSSPVPKKFRDR